ncbi:MAG: SIS domain-containing protein, partial [Alphaproteobacteria bacterium]
MKTQHTIITDQLQDAIALRHHILNDQALLQKLNALAVDCQNAIQAGGKIIFAGNGGSMADAQHLAAEFVGRFVKERIPLAAICLGTNISSTTAIGND